MNVARVGLVVFLSMLALDIGYSIYFNSAEASNANSVNESISALLASRETLMGELNPRTFYPTERGFQLHKPGMSTSGDAYGETSLALMDCSTLTEDVLVLRHVRFVVDEHGFRTTTPPEQSRIFALGDSFTFGADTTQDKVWVERLAEIIDEPVYNLGVNGTGPKQHLMLLEYLLETKRDYFQIEHLLWTIFEGNDLTDRYETSRPVPKGTPSANGNPFRGTIIETLFAIPDRIRHGSVINRLLTGRMTIGLPTQRTGGQVSDCVMPTARIYRSDSFGPRLFDQRAVGLTNMPESYVIDHPNRPFLDQTFTDMKSLSERNGFKVTVVVAPLDARLQGSYFEGIPSISEEPHFMNYVASLAENSGFDVVNLHQLMIPYAEKELLYWRDDSHWNERGNEVVAEIIGNHVFER